MGTRMEHGGWWRGQIGGDVVPTGRHAVFTEQVLNGLHWFLPKAAMLVTGNKKAPRPPRGGTRGDSVAVPLSFAARLATHSTGTGCTTCAYMLYTPRPGNGGVSGGD